MGGGSWNQVNRGGDRPAHLSAWGKYKLGWVNPTVVIGKLENEQISAASNQADVYRLLTGSPGAGGEYFLIENRQQSGFDEGLPGAGIAIWHIDESKADNTQECKTATGCSTAHYKVALEQADGLFDLENNRNRGDAEDIYVSGKTFTSSTVPNSLLYGGKDHQLSVTNISALGDVMTATIDASSYYSPGRIAAGDFHAVFIQSDGSLWTWGNNKPKPVRIGTDTDWQTVAAGWYNNVALKNDGSLWAWGSNNHGQLGDGTTIAKNSPVRIGTDNNWQAITSGSYHVVAIKSDGSLWGWGYNNDGELGDGTTEEKHSPTRIGTENNWQTVDSKNYHTVAVKTDGSLWTWGRNYNGQLGNGTTDDKHSPIRVGAENNWRAVTAGGWHTAAIKDDGTLWAWGLNYDGQLGDGTANDKSVPVQIGTGSDWKSITAGNWHTIAIKNNGNLWACGDNEFGQLGDGTKENKYIPAKIGTDVDWYFVDGGYLYTLALKKNGSLWAWGNNLNGQLGDGTTSIRYEPVRIIFSSSIDTDNDGIDDGWEMTYFNNLTTANDTNDADKDGYSDKQEYLNWLAGETDPDGTVYNPTAKNAPGGTGYVAPAPVFIPAIYKLLLKH